MDKKDVNTYIKSMFDFVRIIDPVNNKILQDDYTEGNHKCYNFWSCKDICKNCVGARAYNNENKSFVKIEYNNDSVYLVMAKAVKDNNNKYILECVKDVTKSDIVDDISKLTNDQIQEEVERMNMLVALDVLTECFNRRYINEKLPIEIARAKKYKKNLSVMMMDIDYFKEINDEYGHLAGDYVLKKVVKIVKENIRALSDWIARYGGEEFVVVLNNTDSSKAFSLAERIRLAIENATFNYKKESIKVTVSIGVTSLSDNISNKNQLIERADENLYKAKIMGRNICIMDGDSITCK